MATSDAVEPMGGAPPADGAGVLFREVQSRKPAWVWGVVLLVAAAAWWGVVQQLLLGIPFGTRPAPDGALLVLAAVLGVGLPALFGVLRLIVEVDADGVSWKLFPIAGGRIGADRIASARAITYRPIRDYLGWGYRWTPWAGAAVSLSGSTGVSITLDSGRTLMLGSERAEALAAALERARAAGGARDA